MAPVFTVCEHTIIEKLIEKVGYDEGDGIGVPGEYV